MPAASTSSTSSPSAATGSGWSLTTSFSGPPNSVRWMARMPATLLVKRGEPLVEGLLSQLGGRPQRRIGQQRSVAHGLAAGAGRGDAEHRGALAGGAGGVPHHAREALF